MEEQVLDVYKGDDWLRVILEYTYLWTIKEKQPFQIKDVNKKVLNMKEKLLMKKTK